jgi:GDPmannose 4,6-dehydratase
MLWLRGKCIPIREFGEAAFKAIGVEIIWEGKDSEEKGIDSKTGKVRVEVSPEFYRPAEVNLLVGNPTKAKEKLGWQPKTKFKDLVQIMVEADMKRVGSHTP